MMLYMPEIYTPKERYNLMCYGCIYDPGVIIHYPWNKSTSHAYKGEAIVLTVDYATERKQPAATGGND